MAEMLGAKEVAQELGTSARELRKFLRDTLPKDEQPGQGGRYAFSKAQVKKLAKQFNAWGQPKAKKAEETTEPVTDTPKTKAPAKPKGKAKPAPEQVEEIEEIIDLDDLDGPSDEELEGDEDKDPEE